MTAGIADLAPAVVARWIGRQRWFSAKHRTPRSVRVVLDSVFAAGGHLVLVDVVLDDGDTQRYHLVVGVRDARPPDRLAPALIGSAAGRWYYDALADPVLCQRLFDLIRTGRVGHGVAAAIEPSAQPPPAAPGPVRLLGEEQSNSSVVFGERYILKVIRRVWPGDNPELTVPRALLAVGNPYVAAPVGAVHTSTSDGPATLAVLQEFAVGAEQGWARTLSALRSPDGADRETGELYRLGAVVARVHADLAAVLGTATMPVDHLPDRLRAGLAAASGVVPALRDHAAAVERIAAEVRDTVATLPTAHRVLQRIHGDLHLGQVLHTPRGWLVIDFEGEPGTPMATRAALDSPLRDVAGLLRSLDYAAGHVALGAGRSVIDEPAIRSRVRRYRRAVLAGYSATAGATPLDDMLLNAYQLEKALYEVRYEAANRPQWMDLPLRAVAELTGDVHVAG